MNESHSPRLAGGVWFPRQAGGDVAAAKRFSDGTLPAQRVDPYNFLVPSCRDGVKIGVRERCEWLLSWHRGT